jgi:hypothetical protein
MPNKLLFGGWAIPVEAKTASFTVKERDCGKLFTNRGAGAGITISLPSVLSHLKGFWFEVTVVAAQTVTITTADKLLYHANATADTIVLPATIGMHLKIVCDGTSYLVQSDPTAATAATAVTAVTLTDN